MTPLGYLFRNRSAAPSPSPSADVPRAPMSGWPDERKAELARHTHTFVAATRGEATADAVAEAKQFFAEIFGAPPAAPGPHQRTTITPADAEATLRKLGRWQ
jgi:hypothetical protein